MSVDTINGVKTETGGKDVTLAGRYHILRPGMGNNK